MKATLLWNAQERLGSSRRLSVSIDDPTFAQPIRAQLFESDTKKGAWDLHWTRRMKQDGEA